MLRRVAVKWGSERNCSCRLMTMKRFNVVQMFWVALCFWSCSTPPFMNKHQLCWRKCWKEAQWRPAALPWRVRLDVSLQPPSVLMIHGTLDVLLHRGLCEAPAGSRKHIGIVQILQLTSGCCSPIYCTLLKHPHTNAPGSTESVLIDFRIEVLNTM